MVAEKDQGFEIADPEQNVRYQFTPVYEDADVDGQRRFAHWQVADGQGEQATCDEVYYISYSGELVLTSKQRLGKGADGCEEMRFSSQNRKVLEWMTFVNLRARIGVGL